MSGWKLRMIWSRNKSIPCRINYISDIGYGTQQVEIVFIGKTDYRCIMLGQANLSVSQSCDIE